MSNQKFFVFISLAFVFNRAVAQLPTELYQLPDARYRQVSSYDTTGGNNDRINILPGKTVTIFDQRGPGVISRIWVTIDSRDPAYLRRIWLRMYWDDEKTPSVSVPVGDFFGCGFQYKHHMSQYVGMSSGGFYCYFPMPFGRRARVEVVNDTGQEVYAFYYHIGFHQLKKPLPPYTAYFHAFWNRELRTQKPQNYVALEAQGRGQLVGVSLNMQPYRASLLYLEGDEQFYVDGERQPSVPGTGLEDYFTSGWYFKNGEFSAPYHGLVLLDPPTGRVTAYHHHIPDRVPFERSLRVTFEHGHGNTEEVDMSSVTYWYQQEPHGPHPAPLPPALRIPLRRPIPPGAITPEKMTVQGAQNRWVDMTNHGPDWLDNRQLRIVPASGQATVAITGLDEAAYDVDLYASAGDSLSAYTVSAGAQSVRVADTTAKGLIPLPPVALPNVPAKAGTLRLDLRPLRSGGQAMMAVDAIRLTPVRRFVTDWYLIGPFPDPRLSDYNRKGLDTVYPPEQEIDLTKTYGGVDNQPVRWFRYTEGKAGYEMRLWKFFKPTEFIVSYALTYVYAPEERVYKMLVSTDDAGKIFVNDQPVYRFFDASRIAAPDQDAVTVRLRKGWNKLLVKAENNFGGYAFYVRFIDPDHTLVFNADQKLN